MRSKRIPTGEENAASRLFLRFLLCFLLFAPMGWLLAMRGVWDVNAQAIGRTELAFVIFAAVGGLSLLTRPYLLVLCGLKALYDAALLYRITGWAAMGAIGILQWNLCFFLTVTSLILFLIAASQAELFAFFCTKRDGKLLFSREMGGYLLRALLLIAISLSLYFIWPRLCEMMGMSPVPLN